MSDTSPAAAATPGRKVLLVAPQHHGITGAFTESSLKLQSVGIPGWAYQFETVSGCGITVARNFGASRLEQEKADILGFLATDIGFTPADIARALSHFERDPELGIVGGCYVKKEHPLRLVLNALDHVPPTRPDGLIEVKECGTDFMFIARHVFDRIRSAWPTLHPHEDLKYIEDDSGRICENFFQMRVVNQRFLTEDWAICHLAREVGYKVFVDSHILLDHFGNYNFSAKALARKAAPSSGGLVPVPTA